MPSVEDPLEMRECKKLLDNRLKEILLEEDYSRLKNIELVNAKYYNFVIAHLLRNYNRFEKRDGKIAHEGFIDFLKKFIVYTGHKKRQAIDPNR